MTATGGIAVSERKGRATFSVKVVPRASRTEISGIKEGVLQVRLMAPPVGGAANNALVKLLSQVLEIPERDIEITVGQTGRHKVVCVDGLSADDVAARLQTSRQ